MNEFDELTEGRLEDNLPSSPEEENVTPMPSKAHRREEACFPVNGAGMPRALYEIPSRERPFFWKNGRYRGFEIAYVAVQIPEHKYLFARKPPRSFYVRSKGGTIGLVPFPNSIVVWPWEVPAWKQDLAPENRGKIRSDLKTAKK